MLILHALDQDSCITGTQFPIGMNKKIMQILSKKYNNGDCKSEKGSGRKIYGYRINDNNNNINDNVEDSECSNWMITMAMIK